MRLYTLSLTHLRPLHQGVQNLHSLGEMIAKYVGSETEPLEKYTMLLEWATKHKTTIFLDGGFASDLIAVRDILKTSPYPWAEFNEDEETLFGITTSVGVILPGKVYEAADFVRKGGVLPGPSMSGKIFYEQHVLSLWDIQFIENVLLKHRLAS